MRTHFFILSSFCIAGTSHAGIVNVLSPDVGETEEGWNSSAKISLQHLAGNESKLAVSLLAGTRYRHGANEIFLKGSGDWGSASEEVYSKKAFAHVRYKRQLHNAWSAFGFAQVDHNEFRSLLMRDLLGGGIEWTFIDTPHFKANVAAGIMGELEWALGNDSASDPTWRSSNYLTLAWEPNESMSFGSTTFVQPLVSNPGDVRAFEQIDLKIDLTSHLAWSTTWKIEMDSQPADSTVETVDSSIKSGLVLSW